MSGRRQNTSHRQKVRREHFTDQGNQARMLQAMASELAGTSMAVRVNGRDYRIECGRCSWSVLNATVSSALAHEASH